MKLPASKSIFKYWIILCFTSLISSCATAPPTQEMSDARQSVEAAESVGAEKHAPVALDSAQQLLSKAEDDLQAGDYEEAQREALAAREAAHQAVAISQAKQVTEEVEMETIAIEEPVVPVIEPTPPAEPEPSFYTVIIKDNLWKISAKNSIYGDPLLWPLILKANPELISDADLITPNMVLMIEPNPSRSDKDAARQHAKFRGITTRKQKDASYLRQYGLR